MFLINKNYSTEKCQLVSEADRQAFTATKILLYLIFFLKILPFVDKKYIIVYVRA